MTALIEFVSAHPWWTLVYLTVISGVFHGGVIRVVRK